jgi:hypothetical protein
MLMHAFSSIGLLCLIEELCLCADTRSTQKLRLHALIVHPSCTPCMATPQAALFVKWRTCVSAPHWPLPTPTPTPTTNRACLCCHCHCRCHHHHLHHHRHHHHHHDRRRMLDLQASGRRKSFGSEIESRQAFERRTTATAPGCTRVPSTSRNSALWT